MFLNSEFMRWRDVAIRQFANDIVQHHVGHDEFCSLLLSRCPLERCDETSAHCCGLPDLRSGELFDIQESELYSSLDDKSYKDWHGRIVCGARSRVEWRLVGGDNTASARQ